MTVVKIKKRTRTTNADECNNKVNSTNRSILMWQAEQRTSNLYYFGGKKKDDTNTKEDDTQMEETAI